MHRALLLALSLALVFLCRGAVGGGCYLDGSAGSPLPFPPVDTPQGMCSRGLYCPNSEYGNVSTFPRFCPPTPECIATRRRSEFCSPQGLFEPAVCDAGWYCPTGRSRLPCPAGYWCYYGMTEPQVCTGLMHCPAGTAVPYDYSGLLAVVVLDAILVAFILVVYRGRLLSPKPTISGDPCGEWSSMSPDEQSVIVRGMTESRGRMMPVDILCDNLTLKIPAADGKPEKVVLSGVNAHIRPGRLTAIMGPSGAGKTMLLSSILGKLPSSWATTGSLLVNGLPSIKEIRHVVGYVPQDDAVHAELTVFENVSMHAELRLDRSWPKEMREEFTGIVIKALGLQAVADVRIGGGEQAGVSGGQRKRTSIANEIVSAPAVLFLDEPTTGLDSSTAMDLCRILKSLAVSANLTIVMVVHQPRVEIWRELDQILLLAPGGRTVYEGPGSKAAESYFHATLGFDFTVGNPADVVLDGIAASGDVCAAEWEKSRQESAGTKGDICASALRDLEPPKLHAASFLRQVALFHRRSVMKQAGQFWWLLQDIFLSVVLAAFMASAAIRTQPMSVLAAPYTVINPKSTVNIVPMLCMYYGIAIAAVVPATAIRPFGNERRQFWHEASTGSLNRLAYFIGVASAQVYRLILTSLHFTLVVYFMWNPLVGFGNFFGVLFLSFACTDAQSVLLASFIKPRNAPILTSVASIFIALFNGYPQIPFVGIAAHSFYMTEGIFTKVLEPIAYLLDTRATMFKVFGYEYGRFGTDVLAMCLILLILHAISFALLVFTYREKQR
jgi:ABC-type multidrug transport system ATPase subunit